jgi:hypothetical protein
VELHLLASSDLTAGSSFCEWGSFSGLPSQLLGWEGCKANCDLPPPAVAHRSRFSSTPEETPT